jgi:hypothetical protein
MVALVYGNGRLATLQLLERIRTPGAGRMVRVRTNPAVPRIYQAAEATRAASCTLSRCTRLSPPPPMR